MEAAQRRLMKMRTGKANRSTWRNPTLISLSSPQIPHDLNFVESKSVTNRPELWHGRNKVKHIWISFVIKFIIRANSPPSATQPQVQKWSLKQKI
jgi:hypothetical protein